MGTQDLPDIHTLSFGSATFRYCAHTYIKQIPYPYMLHKTDTHRHVAILCIPYEYRVWEKPAYDFNAQGCFHAISTMILYSYSIWTSCWNHHITIYVAGKVGLLCVLKMAGNSAGILCLSRVDSTILRSSKHLWMSDKPQKQATAG